MYRNTYVEVNVKNIENNVRMIIERYNEYEYYFGVVKADCYGHNNLETVKAIINGGCNYLAVATLDEALEIRREIKGIPILCLGIIPVEFLSECEENNITITISNLEYLKKMFKQETKNLKVHIKINSGMNRLGINNKEEFNSVYRLLKERNYLIEGVYTHVYNPTDSDVTKNQFRKFEEITSEINLNEIPIVHICASDATMLYPKATYVNGCRLGIAMYGLTEVSGLELLPTFGLYSEIIQINVVENETVGYNGVYKVKDKEKIAVIPIGYADGIIRKNTGRKVYINDKTYQIVGNICMDMMFVKVDDTVKVGDKIVIIRDIEHIEEIAKHLETIPYEILCSISKRVPRIYV